MIDPCDESHATLDDPRQYKGEKAQQDYEDTNSISVSSEAQKNWPRKCLQINKNKSVESAMMCRENLEDSEQEAKTKKTIAQDEEMNDDKEKQDDEMDDKEHVESTVHMGNQLKISVEELKLGVDDDALTLATQETSVKNLVYIMNIQAERQGIIKDARNDGKNPSEQVDKKPTAKSSPLEKSLPVNHSDDLKDYGESGIDNNLGREKEWKKKAKKTKKLYIWNSIWMMTWKNNRRMLMMEKQNGKFELKRKQYTIMNLVVKTRAESKPTQKIKKTKDDHEITKKNDENDKAPVTKEMTLSNIGNNIFIGDSAATSHMANNKTGVCDLTPIRGSVVIGNGESISCTH